MYQFEMDGVPAYLTRWRSGEGMVQSTLYCQLDVVCIYFSPPCMAAVCLSILQNVGHVTCQIQLIDRYP